MIKLFYPSMKIPNWLISVEANGPNFKPGQITFNSFGFMYTKSGQYRINSIVGKSVISVKNIHNANIKFHSPTNENKQTLLLCPTMSYLNAFTGLITIISATIILLN